MLKKTTYELASSVGFVDIRLDGDDLVIRHFEIDGLLLGEVRVEATRGFMAELTEAVSEIEREVIG
jgi:hypothetical protein